MFTRVWLGVFVGFVVFGLGGSPIYAAGPNCKFRCIQMETVPENSCTGSPTPSLKWVFGNDHNYLFADATMCTRESCRAKCREACGNAFTVQLGRSTIFATTAAYISNQAVVAGNSFCIEIAPSNVPTRSPACTEGAQVWTPPTCGEPASVVSEAAASTTPATPPGEPGLPGPLHLPDCATSHNAAVAGKCTLDDIKQVGVNFANFLMGLAAAFFLLIFVYAGFKYIFFAYDSGAAGEAQKMLTGSAIGMLLVLGAATIVRFIESTATGGAPPTAASNPAPAGASTPTPPGTGIPPSPTPPGTP